MSLQPTIVAMTGLLLTGLLLLAFPLRRPQGRHTGSATRFTVLIERRRS